MKVLAPGKLILSGEHAAVYGKPALAMAVNRYVIATVTPQLLPFVSFDLSDLEYERRLSLSALNHLKNCIKEKYQRFLQGEFKIRDVLQKPVELAQFAFGLVFENLNLKLTQGIKIHIQSDLPIGCGMGSSAAMILSVLYAMTHHFQLNLSSEAFLRLGQEAENMQHGYSSGLDLRVSLHGGCVFMHEGVLQRRTIPTLPLYLINTGTPKTNTGECVSAVAHHFKTSHIGDDFSATTTAMDVAFQENNLQKVIETIRKNHQLLTTIGVVPQTVQRFISEVEGIGAAKICGAGAIGGEKAGVVLAVTEDEATLKKMCANYHYFILPISGEARGVHVV